MDTGWASFDGDRFPSVFSFFLIAFKKTFFFCGYSDKHLFWFFNISHPTAQYPG